MTDIKSLIPGTMPENNAGQSTIAYRAGTYGSLSVGMLHALAKDTDYLRDLNTRDPTDPAIALIDSWAIAGDVLTFYAERIANESFLRTAKERRSIRSLARLLDYELAPGKAAETYVAFTVEDAPSAAPEVAMPVGVRINSMPGPGEHMVAFETVEAFTAYPHLNAMRPRLDRAQTITDVITRRVALCVGVLNDIRKGHWALTKNGGAPALHNVERVTVHAEQGTTEIALVQDANPIRTMLPFLYLVQPIQIVFAGQSLSPLFIQGQIAGKRRDQTQFDAEMKSARIAPAQLRAHLNYRKFIPPAPPPPLPTPTGPDGVFVFEKKAAVFGHNIPPDGSPPAMSTAFSSGKLVQLDAEYAELRPEQWIAFLCSSQPPHISRVEAVDMISASNAKMRMRVSRVKVVDDLPAAWDGVSAADVTVLILSRPLPLAPLPVEEVVAGSDLLLDRFYDGLFPNKRIALTGERDDLPGVMESELHDIAAVWLEDGYTRLTLKGAVAGPFRRNSVTINANVARATHGESGGGPIGHGNGAAAGQAFRLPVGPLTHISAAGPTGIAPELRVFVDGIEWARVASLRDADAQDRVFALSYDEDGGVWVKTGDGVHGRRVTSGVNNITALWRKGSGGTGMVRAGQLSLLANAPQGVKAARNPLPAFGAADGERLADARIAVPQSVATLGRVVTLSDYAAFARGFGAIAKAHAAWSWSGIQRRVILSVAGIDGALVADGDIANLTTALQTASDGSVPFQIIRHTPVFFRMAAGIKCIAGYDPDAVSGAVQTALAAHFAFTARGLGQSVSRSEGIAVMQSVAGVDWVDLDALYRGESAILAEVIPAALPRSGGRDETAPPMVGAEMLTLHPAGANLRRILA